MTETGFDDKDEAPRRVTGRDIVAALRNSPLADVEIERLSVEAPVRDVPLGDVSPPSREPG